MADCWIGDGWKVGAVGETEEGVGKVNGYVTLGPALWD